MITTSYLDALDKLLLLGISQISPEFARRQADFTLGKQLQDGGFSGRLGGADLYYTDFGIRIIRLLSPETDTLLSTARWIADRHSDAKNVLDCFSLLNSARLLNDIGFNLPTEKASPIARLHAQRVAQGAYGRPGSNATSSYNTFIASLCFEMLETDFPDVPYALAAIRGLKRPDGGYSETSDQSLSQTNASVAAIAFLTMHNVSDPGDAESTADFLSRMQTGDGGLLAQPSAPEADLLSTFTGVLSLFGLNALNRLDLRAVAEFVGRLAHPQGGFRACLSDDEPDVEYTYYGVGTMALLRVYILSRQSESPEV
ncbi:MAG: prenyltransferase/squalene oxidase repeat-containing protein [Armatimonadota bacterium]